MEFQAYEHKNPMNLSSQGGCACTMVEGSFGEETLKVVSRYN